MNARSTRLALLVTGWLAVAPAAQVPDGAPATSTVTPARTEAVRAVLAELVERGVPGASAAVVTPDGALVAATAGHADEGVPLTVEHRFLSGSVGKTYVTAVAHGLVERGLLRWDEPVAERFESAADAVPGEWLDRVPNARRVTLRQLLRHTSGIPRYVFVPAFWERLTQEPERVWRPEELLAFVFDRPPLFAPDEGWAYADTNYIVVGMLIEHVTNEPFYDRARRELLAPHGLEDTVPTNVRRIEGLAQGHVVVGRQMGIPERTLRDGELVYNVQFEWCGGGWACTPSDLARWIGLLYGGEALEGAYLGTLLDTVDAPALGPGVGYGLGAMVRETPLGRLVFHDGFMPGYLTSAGYFPELDLAVALQTNVDDGARVGRALSDVLVELARAVGAE